MSDFTGDLTAPFPGGFFPAIPRAGGPAEQHVYNHYDKQGITLNVKVERNTKGYNFEVTVIGASSVDEAMALVKEATEKLKVEYGNA